MKPKITTYTNPLTLSEVITTEKDNNSDGKIDSLETITNTYNKQGNLTSSVTAIDSNADGKIDNRSTTDKTYDQQGNVTRLVEEINGVRFPSKYFENNTYDKQGNLTSSIRERDFAINGTIDTRTTINKIYDDRGRLTSSIEGRDRNGDGSIDLAEIERYTYDKQGNITKSEAGFDFDADGKIDGQKVIVTNTYNQQGKLTLSVRDSDEKDSDGNPKKYIKTNTYDDRGNLIREASTENSGARDSIATTFVKNYTYDKQGKIAFTESESNFQVGTVPTKIINRETYKNGKLTLSEFLSKQGGEEERTSKTYDDRGNLTIFLESSTDTDRPFNNITNNTYDKQNNLIRSVFGIDGNGDGEIDNKTTTKNTYNKQNNLIRSVADRETVLSPSIENTYNQQGKLTLSVTESKVNGKLNSRDTIRNTYNQKGNLARSVFESDRNGDGNIDTRRTTASTYDAKDKLTGVNISSRDDKNVDRLTSYQAVVSKGTNGNDLLTGTNKADVLTGGGAADIFVIKAKSGFDTITDFKKGEDLISLGKGINFSQLSFSGDRISLCGNTLATLTGIQTSTLTASDFIDSQGFW